MIQFEKNEIFLTTLNIFFPLQQKKNIYLYKYLKRIQISLTEIYFNQQVPDEVIIYGSY